MEVWEGHMRRTILCLLPLAAAFAATPAMAQSGAWRVSEVTGDVKIAEGGRTRAASRGALLSGGSVIAGVRARAVLVRGRQYVVVAPNTTLRVDSAPAGRDMIQMILDAGSAVFRVDKREAPHFRVQTRYLAAVVRGTTFSVTVTPTGGSVQVTEGAVEVSTPDGGARDLVRPGMIATVSSSDLYQLSISGDQSRTIRSPAAPAAQGGAASSAPPAAAGPTVRIGAPIGEAPVRLSDATNGLVRGNAAIDLAFARTPDGTRPGRSEGSRPEQAGRPDHSRPDNVSRPDQSRPDSPGNAGGNDGNRGHGNDEDRDDEDNPGRDGQNDRDDDDRGDGNGNGGNGNGNGGNGSEGPGSGGGDGDGADGNGKGHEDDNEDREDQDGGDGDAPDGKDEDRDDDDDSDDGKDKDPGDGGDDGGDSDDADNGGKDKDRDDEDDDDADSGKDKDRDQDDDDDDDDRGKDKDRGDEDDENDDDDDDDDDDRDDD
jgi:hypothetical protein